MKPIFLLALTSALFLMPIAASAGENRTADAPVRVAETECAQVIHCGIDKDGKAQTYPTKCAAEKDGATHITPKGEGPCPAIK